MSKTKLNGNMSKTRLNGNNLPPLQKEILIHLSQNGPQTKNETCQTMKRRPSYKPLLFAFNSLKNKNLIMKTDFKIYRNRKYPRFWLSEKGLFHVLLTDADKNVILKTIRTFFPNREDLMLLVEISMVVPQEWLIGSYMLAEKYGMDIASMPIIYILPSKKTSEEEALKIMARIKQVLKRYPEYYAEFVRRVREASQRVKDLEALSHE